MTPSSHAPSRAVLFRWLPAILCVLVAGLAFWVMGEVDKPWGGKTGRILFDGTAAQMDALSKYREVWRCCLDPGHPAREHFGLANWKAIGVSLARSGPGLEARWHRRCDLGE